MVRDKISLLDIGIKAVLVIIFLNILLCTVRRFKSISRPVLVVHLGCLLTMAGGLGSSLGFVATVNIYEGTTTGSFYRWDLAEDVPLGFELAVDRINASYYPSMVKVGVLRNGEKAGLFILKTGEAFDLTGYRVEAHAFDFKANDLELRIFAGDRLLGVFNTGGGDDLPVDFPYDFKLVAFQDPVLKRVWTDISLWQDNSVVARGTAEVNHPFTWNNMRFYNTQVDSDPAGRPYAGIQIVKDPGLPFVYAGISLVCLGALFCFFSLRARGRGLIVKTQE